MKNLKKTTGQRIKELREEAGISQELLAKKAGTSSRTILEMEAGTANFTIDKLQAIAKALGVPVEIVLGKA